MLVLEDDDVMPQSRINEARSGTEMVISECFSYYFFSCFFCLPILQMLRVPAYSFVFANLATNSNGTLYYFLQMIPIE